MSGEKRVLCERWSEPFPSQRIAFQGQGIGRRLVDMVKDKYRDYMRIVVVAYDDELHFYESCGFRKNTDASAMCITSLWT